jgi:hypothetical protein
MTTALPTPTPLGSAADGPVGPLEAGAGADVFYFNLNAQMALTKHLVRRGHILRPASTDVMSLIISNFLDAPFNVKKLDKNVDRDNILQIDPFYLYHPSTRQDLQSPLAINNPLSPAHNPILIENKYLTSVHSAKDPNVITYTIFMYLPHDVDYKFTIRTVLTHQLTRMQDAGLPTSLDGLNTLKVTESSYYPARPELDDEAITSTTQVILP